MIAISVLIIRSFLVNFRAYNHSKAAILTLLVFCLCAKSEAQQHLGVASCASSNCHGSIKAKSGTNVLQNEYVTWKRHDSHSKAWSVLTNNDSKLIGKHLGISEPEKDKLCLSCHSTLTENSGEKFSIEDGVGCESCHGASSNWIKTHTESDATHENNISNGMKDLVSIENRSTVCLGCHLGNKDAQVTHRLIGAGHPRLTFEIETFSEIMPRHWKYDEDYNKRKAKEETAQSWLTGQIVHAKSFLEFFIKSSEKDLIPDFTFFNCYSCHHSLTEDQWKSRNYHGAPGKLNINTSSLTLISLSLDNQDLKNKINNLQKTNQRAELISTAREIIKTLNSVKSTDINTKQALKRIIKYSQDNPYPQYELAEQIMMAINVLSGKDSKEFKEIYKTLEKEEAFRAEHFTRALRKLR